MESEAGIKEILEDDVYRKRYNKLNLRKLVLILEKYKNDKTTLDAGKSTGNEELDKVMRKMKIVRKSDGESVAKKLKESLVVPK